MIEFQTRDPALDEDWGYRPSRSAGLYGELQALPVRLPVEESRLPPVTRARRKNPLVD